MSDTYNHPVVTERDEDGRTSSRFRTSGGAPSTARPGMRCRQRPGTYFGS